MKSSVDDNIQEARNYQALNYKKHQESFAKMTAQFTPHYSFIRTKIFLEEQLAILSSPNPCTRLAKDVKKTSDDLNYQDLATKLGNRFKTQFYTPDRIKEEVEAAFDYSWKALKGNHACFLQVTLFSLLQTSRGFSEGQKANFILLSALELHKRSGEWAMRHGGWEKAYEHACQEEALAKLKSKIKPISTSSALTGLLQLGATFFACYGFYKWFSGSSASTTPCSMPTRLTP